MTDHDPRIVVVGGGPGGLTLARVLARHDVEVTVLEREGSASARDQGRSLDLHPASGQAAMRAAGLYDAWAAAARWEDQATRRLGTDGSVLLEELVDPAADGHPEMDRGTLRGLLLDSLAPGTVRWGTRLEAVTPRPDGRHDLVLAGGETLTADLVVGADGAWSRVRPLLSDARPEYCGVTFAELIHTDVDRRHPEIGALAGRGSAVVSAGGSGLVTQRLDAGALGIYVTLRVDEHWAETFPTDDPPAAKAQLLAWFEGWAPALRALIADADDRITARPIHALPVDHHWPNHPGVTLLGDAAHVMSPFGGQGANLAMLDGADLAAAIVEDPATATARYEALMRPRAARSARGAAVGVATFGDDDGDLDHRQAYFDAIAEEDGVTA